MTDPISQPYWLTLGGQLGLPALVAAAVTFFLNRRLERIRGRREINTRTFDAARDNAREFARLTSRYWVHDRTTQDVDDETQILLAQNDVLVDVANALELVLDADRDEIETAIDELLRFGTGGNFQSAERKADIARAQRIPGAAARLRQALMASRRRLLERRNA